MPKQILQPLGPYHASVAGVVVELLPDSTRFRSYTRGRHSVFRDAPEAYEDMRVFLDEIQAQEADS